MLAEDEWVWDGAEGGSHILRGDKIGGWLPSGVCESRDGIEDRDPTDKSYQFLRRPLFAWYGGQSPNDDLHNQ